MTTNEFASFWQTVWPDSPPIGHFFRHHFQDRWFRIHSLPQSQRYPANASDLEILLNRQNTILSDLLGEHSAIYLVTGEYNHADEEIVELHPPDQLTSIASYHFTKLPPIDLYLLDSGFYEKGQTYNPMFAAEHWRSHQYDAILTDIAEDNLRLFFLSVTRNCIIAPYDGGMDIILADTATRDHYKAKYAAWLSTHESGL